MSSECVICGRAIRVKNHAFTVSALRCVSCSSWTHRACCTGISLKDYGETTFSFTCEKCHDSQEDTTSGPAESTLLHQSLEQRPDYGVFDMSVISAVSSTSASLNTTYIVSAEYADTPDMRDPASEDTPDPTHPDETPGMTDPASEDTPDPTHPDIVNRTRANVASPTHADIADPPLADIQLADLTHPADTTAPTHGDLTASFDVTRKDVQDPPEILEDSLREPDLPDTILPDVPVTYSIIEEGTQRKAVKLVSSDGYEYTKKMSKGDFTYWRCIKRSKTANCPATVSQKGSAFKTTYSKRGPEYRYIRTLMALPFLPSHDIQPAFDQLAPRATSAELRQLVNYVDNTWISSTVWLPRNWSIFQLTIRTNNDVEGWHNRVNSDIGKAHQSFYVVAPALKREADLVDLSYHLVTEEQIIRDQRIRYRELQGRLHQFWSEYEEGDKTASQLLRDCGKVYGPAND